MKTFYTYTMILTHRSYRKLQYSHQSTEKHIKQERLQNKQSSSGFTNDTRMQIIVELITIQSTTMIEILA